MFFSLRELEIRPQPFEQSYPVGEFKFDLPGKPGAVTQSDPVVTSGVAELESLSGEIHVTGHIAANLETECAKCLEKAVIAVDSDFDLRYLPEGLAAEGGEVEIDDIEAEVGFYSGHGLQLRDVIEEYLLLAVPMRPVCSEDCLGLCPVCGTNRNEQQCKCSPSLVDERLLALKTIKAVM